MCIKYAVKIGIAISGYMAIILAAGAQYYYKDIITTDQISKTYQMLKLNKVSQVNFGTFIQNQPVQDGIQLEQTIDARLNRVITYTNTASSGESWLLSYYNENGQLIKSTDSTKETVTTAIYNYDAGNHLIKISSVSTARDHSIVTEVHNWMYGSNGQPQKMIKIKNNTDTTFVDFTPDEKGNTAEEKATRNKYSLGITYYYYDNNNRLTDVARYHKKADRILPDYMFEYNTDNKLSKMILVPDGSSDYQTWLYTYNEKGLKLQETCYNKQKHLAGKVEYLYKFSN